MHKKTARALEELEGLYSRIVSHKTISQLLAEEEDPYWQAVAITCFISRNIAQTQRNLGAKDIAPEVPHDEIKERVGSYNNGK